MIDRFDPLSDPGNGEAGEQVVTAKSAAAASARAVRFLLAEVPHETGLMGRGPDPSHHAMIPLCEQHAATK